MVLASASSRQSTNRLTGFRTQSPNLTLKRADRLVKLRIGTTGPPKSREPALASETMSIEAEDCLNNRKLHVILDNLNTHKKNEHWLKAHPNVQFHFTPTSASWLNQLAGAVAQRHLLHKPQAASGPHRCLCQRVQRQSPALRLDEEKGSVNRRFKGRRITQLWFRVLN